MLPLKLYFAAPLLIVVAALPLERNAGGEGLRRFKGNIPDLPSLHSVRDRLGPPRSQYVQTGGQSIINDVLMTYDPWKSSMAPQQGDGSHKGPREVRRNGGYNKVIEAREIQWPENPLEDLPRSPSSEPADILQQESQSNKAPGDNGVQGEKQPITVIRKSPEIKEATSKSVSQKVREAWARRSPEEKAAISQKRRESWANKSPEQKAETTRKQREAKTNKSPEEKAATAKKRQETEAGKSPEEKAAFSQKVSQAMQRVHAQKSPEAKAATSMKISQAMRDVYTRKSPEEKSATSQKLRESHAKKSPEEKAARSQRMREAHASKSPEEKAATSQKKRETWERKSAEEKAANAPRKSSSEAIREAHARKSPEEKAAISEKKRKSWERKSSEAKAAISQARSQSQREAWANKSPEEIAATSQKISQKQREVWDRRSPEERAAIPEKQQQVWERKSPEEKIAHSRKLSEIQRARRAAQGRDIREVTDDSHIEMGETDKPPSNDKFSIDMGELSWTLGDRWKDYWSRFLERVSLPLGTSRKIQNNRGGLYVPAFPNVRVPVL